MPERPGSAGGRSIGVQVIRVPARATTPRPDPVLVIVGGPGQSATALAPMLVTRFNGILATRDLILVDQRGTGGSNRLACGSGASADPSRLLGPPYTTPEIAACWRELSARADLGAYITSFAADDLERVREALGVREWTLVAGSYGTKVAMEYARRFPRAVRAMVLEGVAGPEYPNPLPHAMAGQAALDALFASCAADAACQRAYPDLSAHFAALLARLDSGAVPVAVPGRAGPPLTLDRDNFAYGIHLLLFSNATAPAVPFLVERAWAREYWPMANVLAQVSAALVGQIDIGMQLSVSCAEDVQMFDDAAITRETQGTYLRGMMARGLLEECTRWPVPPAPRLPVVPLSTPALLLSGAFDPATPPSFAARVAERMSRSVAITVPYGAHVSSDPCIESLIAAYVETLAVTESARACLATGRRPPFVTAPGAGR